MESDNVEVVGICFVAAAHFLLVQGLYVLFVHDRASVPLIHRTHILSVLDVKSVPLNLNNSVLC